MICSIEQRGGFAMKRPTRKMLRETYERILQATQEAGEKNAYDVALELAADVYNMSVEVFADKLA